MKRDYYEVLGVTRGADVSDVKKAYRRLARELHPDVNGHDPQAEEKFKEATEAYEVLSDAQKRRTYDTYGHEGLRRGGGTAGGGFTDFSDIFDAFFGGDMFGGGGADIFGRATGRRSRTTRGRDVTLSLQIDLQEAAFGASHEVEVELLDTCPVCGGARTTDPASVKSCPDCGGTGARRSVRSTPLGQFIQTGACPTCRGEGQTISQPCEECKGQGRTRQHKTIEVDVPAGIADGQRLRFAAQGEAGAGGGPPGDLYVEISVAPHPEFERDGDDILSRKDITMVEAALGTTISVATLDGEEEVVLPPGTQPGEVKVLRARGVPHLRRSGRGDHHVLLNVMVPQDLTAAQKDLLRDFDESCGPEHYDLKEEGIFQRIKHLFTR